MEQYLEKLKKAAKRVMLGSEGKSEIKHNLELFIENHPVREGVFERPKVEEPKSRQVPRGIFTRLIFQPMAIVLILAVVAGGGVSLAAESALPGDFLYSVKVGINEEVRTVLSFSDEADAKWNARRAERRLEEAEVLAKEGRLNVEAVKEISGFFKSHVENFEKGFGELSVEAKGGLPNDLRADFETSLRVHEQILAAIAAKEREFDGVSGESLRKAAPIQGAVEPALEAIADAPPVRSILEEVRAKIDFSENLRVETENEIAGRTNGDLKPVAEGKLRAAENKIAEVRKFLAKNLIGKSDQRLLIAPVDKDGVYIKENSARPAPTMGAGISGDAEIDLILKPALALVEQGKDQMKKGLYGEAFISFQEAHRSAQEIKLLFDAGERLDFQIQVGPPQSAEPVGPTQSVGPIESYSEREFKLKEEKSMPEYKGILPGQSVGGPEDKSYPNERGGKDAESGSMLRIEFGETAPIGRTLPIPVGPAVGPVVDSLPVKIQSSFGVLSGKITIGPLCPIEPCQFAVNPYSSRRIVLEPQDAGNKTAIYFGIGNDGRFQGQPPAGAYKLTVTVTDCVYLGCGNVLPKKVVIKASETTQVDVWIDTGIR